MSDANGVNRYKRHLGNCLVFRLCDCLLIASTTITAVATAIASIVVDNSLVTSFDPTVSILKGKEISGLKHDAQALELTQDMAEQPPSEPF